MLEDDVQAGPFSRLRPETVVKAGSRVGNFVEMKKTVLGPALQSPPSDLPGRQPGGRGCQYRGRYDHLQLRRGQQEPDDHRRRGLHRLGHRAGGAGQGRAPGLRRLPARPSPRTSPPGPWPSPVPARSSRRAGSPSGKRNGHEAAGRQRAAAPPNGAPSGSGAGSLFFPGPDVRQPLNGGDVGDQGDEPHDHGQGRIIDPEDKAEERPGE